MQTADLQLRNLLLTGYQQANEVAKTEPIIEINLNDLKRQLKTNKSAFLDVLYYYDQEPAISLQINKQSIIMYVNLRWQQISTQEIKLNEAITNLIDELTPFVHQGCVTIETTSLNV